MSSVHYKNEARQPVMFQKSSVHLGFSYTIIVSYLKILYFKCVYTVLIIFSFFSTPI